MISTADAGIMFRHENVLEAQEDIDALLRATKVIAVLGMKPESHSDQPAHYVPRYMMKRGYEIVPVFVYYPTVHETLGLHVYRRLSEIERPIDMVNVFRRSHDVPPHLDDILAAKPKSVWMQSGIRNDDVARVLADAGIRVVQDRCLMVEHGGLRS